MRRWLKKFPSKPGYYWVLLGDEKKPKMVNVIARSPYFKGKPAVKNFGESWDVPKSYYDSMRARWQRVKPCDKLVPSSNRS
jgi:hypothetical protein